MWMVCMLTDEKYGGDLKVGATTAHTAHKLPRDVFPCKLWVIVGCLFAVTHNHPQSGKLTAVGMTHNDPRAPGNLARN